MAISPNDVVPQNPHETKVLAAKVKSLPVRRGQVDSAADTGADITERLNLEIKNKYGKDRKLGEGTYATVFLGYLKKDPSSKVAIKKIKVMQEYKDGISVSAIREIKFLQELSHPNIIAMHDVYSSKNQNLCLVLEFLPLGDLEMLIRDSEGIRYGTADIKAWMAMLGRGVWWCHENFVLHRDIKPNNLLIAANGEIKLADFGLARSFADPYNRMTWNVITRWYRPPELLYRARHYGGAVDVWSVGCVFAELILRVPYLAGTSDVDQIDKICQAIGSPAEQNWPGVSELQDYVKSDPIRPLQKKESFLGLFGTVGEGGVDLLISTLVLDPRKRVTAKQFLQHRWWTSEPRPTKTENLPRKGGTSARDKVGEDLKRRGGELDNENKVARRLDFGNKNKQAV